MKNIVNKFVFLSVISFIISIFISCQSVSLDYGQPVIDIPNAYVIDSFSVRGSLKDQVRLMNRSTDINISFKVHLHDPKTNTWIDYGTGTLTKINDTDFINSDLEGKLKNIRYFAIAPIHGNEYKYEIAKTNNDLYIYIFNK